MVEVIQLRMFGFIVFATYWPAIRTVRSNCNITIPKMLTCMNECIGLWNLTRKYFIITLTEISVQMSYWASGFLFLCEELFDQRRERERAEEIHTEQKHFHCESFNRPNWWKSFYEIILVWFSLPVNDVVVAVTANAWVSCRLCRDL